MNRTTVRFNAKNGVADNRDACRHAFTLLELMVVIEIIATLASILFPVFVQIGKSALKTSCLSNEKQIGTALTMYAQDYDERTPSLSSSAAGEQINDVWNLLQSYTHSVDVFFCPDRVQTGCMAYPLDGKEDGRCIGYGYNWGPIQTFKSGAPQGGLLADSLFVGGYHIYRGASLASITAPAETFALGDTYDQPFYTISLDHILSTLTSRGSDSLLRHSGRFNMVYVDGHVRSLIWHAGYSELGYGGSIALPRDVADWSKWCIDPNASIYTLLGKMPCGQAASAAVAKGVDWWRE